MCAAHRGPHEEALPGPEGHALLRRTVQVHVLRTRVRHGTDRPRTHRLVQNSEF